VEAVRLKSSEEVIMLAMLFVLKGGCKYAVGVAEANFERSEAGKKELRK
jgi:hypothetical protein